MCLNLIKRNNLKFKIKNKFIIFMRIITNLLYNFIKLLVFIVFNFSIFFT